MRCGAVTIWWTLTLAPACHTAEPAEPVSSSPTTPAPTPNPAGSPSPETAPPPDCEWCGTEEAPDNLTWDLQIADDDEPGDRMVLEGTVVHENGDPVPGVLLYLYHTNSEGEYVPEGPVSGNEARHGHLRGWLRTDDRGRYRIRTIRPAAYPGRTEAAHVHVTVDDGKHPEYWLESFKFAGDPLLTDEDRSPAPDRGGSGIIELKQDESGTWKGTRTIVLPDDPPGPPS